MNEKMIELCELLNINFICNHSFSVDDFLEICECTIDDEGQVLDWNGDATGIWYDELY